MKFKDQFDFHYLFIIPEKSLSVRNKKGALICFPGPDEECVSHTQCTVGTVVLLQLRQQV